MDKEKQKKLLSEIMEADARDGLYSVVSKKETTQTAVEWLVEQLPIRMQNYIQKDVETAKQMEKEQIEKAIDDALNAYGIIKENNK